jgi:hypothetical protein
MAGIERGAVTFSKIGDPYFVILGSTAPSGLVARWRITQKGTSLPAAAPTTLRPRGILT